MGSWPPLAGGSASGNQAHADVEYVAERVPFFRVAGASVGRFHLCANRDFRNNRRLANGRPRLAVCDVLVARGVSESDPRDFREFDALSGAGHAALDGVGRRGFVGKRRRGKQQGRVGRARRASPTTIRPLRLVGLASLDPPYNPLRLCPFVPA